jgi:hypothetical protein
MDWIHLAQESDFNTVLNFLFHKVLGNSGTAEWLFKKGSAPWNYFEPLESSTATLALKKSTLSIWESDEKMSDCDCQGFDWITVAHILSRACPKNAYEYSKAKFTFRTAWIP